MRFRLALCAFLNHTLLTARCTPSRSFPPTRLYCVYVCVFVLIRFFYPSQLCIRWCSIWKTPINWVTKSLIMLGTKVQKNIHTKRGTEKYNRVLNTQHKTNKIRHKKPLYVFRRFGFAKNAPRRHSGFFKFCDDEFVGWICKISVTTADSKKAQNSL